MDPKNCKHHKQPLKKKDKEIPFSKGFPFFTTFAEIRLEK